MIISRYLSREILITLLAVTVILLVIIITGRLAQYLQAAAAGKLDAGALFAVIGYRLPAFLMVILPGSLLIAILLAYGRLYQDSEMVVLFSTGMSQTRLFLITLGVAALISVLTAWLSFFAGPWGLAHLQQVLQQQKNRAEFSMLSPGSFYTDRTSNLVIYAESAGSDNKELHDIYTFKLPSSRADPRDNMWVMSAQSAKQNWRQGVRYIELKDGYRYEGLPGQLNYRVTQFGTYAFKLAEPQLPVTVTKAEGLTTKALLAQPSPANNAEWQWRLSMPILPLMMALIAVPLSRTQPRQGRFTKLLPAMLIYVLYLAGLSSAEKALAAGDLPAWLGLWWLHLIFLLLLAAFYLTKWVRQHRYNKQLQLREGHETA